MHYRTRITIMEKAYCATRRVPYAWIKNMFSRHSGSACRINISYLHGVKNLVEINSSSVKPKELYLTSGINKKQHCVLINRVYNLVN